MFTTLGLMSGTSMDGVDAAVIRTNGKLTVDRAAARDHFFFLPYLPELRARLRKAVTARENDSTVEKELTELHAEAVEGLLRQAGLAREAVNVIGFHGHTIEHRPRDGVTRQIGNGALLAQLTGIDVVNDFRSADMRAGGQGAPLVPLYHAALFHEHKEPLAVLNVGGVANVTYLHGTTILAFDTGPGNALIDDWLHRHDKGLFDEGGKIAAQGTVHEICVTRFLSHGYFRELPPKSLDRNAFPLSVIEHLSLEDGAATLAACTAAAVAKGVSHFPHNPARWYVAGGGRHNVTLMRMLAERLKKAVLPIEEAGINGDALEAEAFGYLAVRSILKLPLSLPTTTGVKTSSATGGVFCPASPGRAP